VNEQRASLEVGVVLPNYGHLASADGIARVADAAEELGFDSVWVTDHLLVDEEVADPYGTVLEPMNCLAWLASRLERVRLGTSIVLLPLRHPVHLAKEAATVQQLSGGRLRLGIGVGWHEPEFHFLGYDFSDRGHRADESLRLMRALWEGRREFGGEYWSFEDAHFGPLPDPLPEIWVAGNSSHSLRRARELGDAWHPLALGPEDVRQAKQSWSEGRIIPRYELRLGEEAERSSSSMRRIDGSPAEVADQISELAQAGVDGVVLSAGLDPERAVRTLREFAREVAPRLAERGHQG
jgi:probable F420-dependent oxidoreductase